MVSALSNMWGLKRVVNDAGLRGQIADQTFVGSILSLIKCTMAELLAGFQTTAQRHISHGRAFGVTYPR